MCVSVQVKFNDSLTITVKIRKLKIYRNNIVLQIHFFTLYYYEIRLSFVITIFFSVLMNSTRL